MSQNIDNQLFDKNGRRIPFEGMRVFNEVSKGYYQLKQPEIDYKLISDRISKYLNYNNQFESKIFEEKAEALKNKINSEELLKNLFSGVHVPFFFKREKDYEDIGEEFENTILPGIEKSFTDKFPKHHFKSTYIGGDSLKERIKIPKESRYQKFIESSQNNFVVGWYFPMALIEYDIASQLKQMDTLPDFNNLVLSGGFDSGAALIGSPELLYNKDQYAPVLCLSSFQHIDDRIMLCLKAYGLHLEFWCLSQMLTPGITQVSEQWSGGLTIFSEL